MTSRTLPRSPLRTRRTCTFDRRPCESSPARSTVALMTGAGPRSLGRAREIFQQRDDARVVEAAAPLDAKRAEELLNDRGRRQRHAELPRGFHDESEAPAVEIDLEAWPVAAGDV